MSWHLQPGWYQTLSDAVRAGSDIRAAVLEAVSLDLRGIQNVRWGWCKNEPRRRSKDLTRYLLLVDPVYASREQAERLRKAKGELAELEGKGLAYYEHELSLQEEKEERRNESWHWGRYIHNQNGERALRDFVAANDGDCVNEDLPTLREIHSYLAGNHPQNPELCSDGGITAEFLRDTEVGSALRLVEGCQKDLDASLEHARKKLREMGTIIQRFRPMEMTDPAYKIWFVNQNGYGSWVDGDSLRVA